MSKEYLFDSAKAKLAGIQSGAARRAKNTKTVAEQALEDLISMKSMLYSLLTKPKCDKCGSEGPKLSESVDIIKTLINLNGEILNRLKGKPPTESTAQRFGSVDEYKKASQALEGEAEYEPTDLPSPPEL